MLGKYLFRKNLRNIKCPQISLYQLTAHVSGRQTIVNWRFTNNPWSVVIENPLCCMKWNKEPIWFISDNIFKVTLILGSGCCQLSLELILAVLNLYLPIVILVHFMYIMKPFLNYFIFISYESPGIVTWALRELHFTQEMQSLSKRFFKWPQLFQK